MFLRALRPIKNHRIALAVVGALIVGLPVVRSATSARAVVSPVQSVVIDGRGNGHGAGLSQWGALGWATQYDKTWQEILAIYYTNTALDDVRDADFRNTPVGHMVVQLSALDGLQTAVISDSLSLTSTSDPTGRTWGSMVAREVPGRNNVYDLWAKRSTDCPSIGDALLPPDPTDGDGTDTTLPGSTVAESTTTSPATTAAPSTTPGSPDNPTATTGPSTTVAVPSGSSSAWVRVARGVTGPITFTTALSDSPNAVAPRDVIGVCQKSRSVRYYRGTVSAVNNAAGRNYTFNTVLLEDYVRGVVPRESPASWAKVGGGKGIHALRAQAVAARSYAVSSRPRSSGAKTCDTSSCQVYGGAASRPRVGGKIARLENPASNAAVSDTAGKVLRYQNGAVAWALFSSSNGGRSITSLYNAVDDPGDAIAANPHHAWSKSVPASTITSKWPQLGNLLNIRVTKRSGGGVWDGWVDSLVLEGSKMDVTLTGDQFRRALKLKSRYLNFTVLRQPDKKSVGQALFIGDSAGASALTDLKLLTDGAYSVAWDVKSLRCVTGTGRGCSTNNVLRAVEAASTPAFAVVQAGYFEDPAAMSAAVDQTMEALLARGVTRVLWVNLSERRLGPDGTPVFAAANAALTAAAEKWEQLTILDWNAASSSDDAARWFVKGTAEQPDFVNLTAAGRSRFALFVRTQLDDLRSRDLLPAAVSNTPVTTVPQSTVPSGEAATTAATSTTIAAGGSTSSTPSSPSTTEVATSTTIARPVVRPLRLGTRGTLVRILQRELAARGYPVRETGYFGTITKRYLKEFQRSQQLPVSGMAGMRTWKALGY